MGPYPARVIIRCHADSCPPSPPESNNVSYDGIFSCPSVIRIMGIFYHITTAPWTPWRSSQHCVSYTMGFLDCRSSRNQHIFLALVSAVLCGTCRRGRFSSLCFMATGLIGIFPVLFSLIRFSVTFIYLFRQLHVPKEFWSSTEWLALEI